MTQTPFRHIRQFRGTLSCSNASRLFDAVVEDCDRVVGLSLLAEPQNDDQRLQIWAHGTEKLVLFLKEQADDSGVELNVNGGFRWEHGSWIIDGFFLVKPGGMFQGTCCFGLLDADEASIRLNPSVRIITIRI